MGAVLAVLAVLAVDRPTFECSSAGASGDPAGSRSDAWNFKKA
jgi:hypothetical protein